MNRSWSMPATALAALCAFSAGCAHTVVREKIVYVERAPGQEEAPAPAREAVADDLPPPLPGIDAVLDAARAHLGKTQVRVKGKTFRYDCSGFVRGMFSRSPGEAYLERLTLDALRTPPAVAAALGNYAVERSFWRDAVYSVKRPILYIVRQRFAAQAANLAAKDPFAETALFETAGHALFVDDAAKFDALLLDFVLTRVWHL